MKIQLFIIAVAVTLFGFTLVGSSSEVSRTKQQDQTEWKNMNHEERIQYMRQTVLPKMRQAFAAFDPVKYERINCKTCHGEGVTNETYKMPNPKLPKLPATPEGWQELMKKDSAAMSFMAHVVKPQMAELLGMSQFDPKTNPEGFGCHNCHTTKKD